MKEYPSIDKTIHNEYVYVQSKADGQNVRVTWNPKKKFYKFGSRHQMIDENTPGFREAVNLIKSKYESDLDKIFKEQKYQEVTCFFEFFGPNSMFGQHVESDIKDVILFDISIHKKGFLEPAPFIKLFQDKVHIPDVLYQGQFNNELYESIRNSTLEGMPFEGVVCKGSYNKKTGLPLMFKVKSLAWLEKLKEHCKDDSKLFEKLV